jgi:hypothetical protein
MAKPNKHAEENRRLWLNADTGDRQKWEREAQQSTDFYLNDQLTDAEADQLRESGMPDFIINRITPIVEMMLFFCTNNNPKWQAVGFEGSDTDIATIHSKIAEYCWDNSKGQSLYAQVVRDALVKGMGYFQIDVDPNQDKGKGEVVFRRINPFDVWVDPKSTDFLFRDASWIIIKKHLSKTQLCNLFPQWKRKIKSANAYDTTSTSLSARDLDDSNSIQSEDITRTFKVDGEEDDIVDFYERYQKVNIKYANIIMKVVPDPKKLEEMAEDVAEDMELLMEEMKVQLMEQFAAIDAQVQAGEIMPERADIEKKKAEKQMEEELAKMNERLLAEQQAIRSETISKVLVADTFDKLYQEPEFAKQVVDYSYFYEPRVELVCSVGDKHLYTRMIETTEIPIVPFCYLHTGTPYPMSCVTPLIGKQREINKAHQLMLHNANLASNLRWLYEEGSIPEDEWENYSASPGALLKVRQGFTMPTPIQPAGINAAFYDITQSGKSDMEYLSGIYSAMQGDTSSQPETYRGLLATDEHGTRRIKAFIHNQIEPALEHIGLIFRDIAQNTYQANKVFRIVQPNASGNLDEEEVEINIPLYNDFGKAIGKYNDYQSSKFDIKIVAGSTMPVNRWALVEEYFRWYQAGLIDDVAMLAETDIRGKDKIVERKSIMAQQGQQIEQQLEQIKDLNDTVESLQNQLVRLGIKDRVRESTKEQEASVEKTKATQDYYRKMVAFEGNAAAANLGKQAKEQLVEKEDK